LPSEAISLFGPEVDDRLGGSKLVEGEVLFDHFKLFQYQRDLRAEFDADAGALMGQILPVGTSPKGEGLVTFSLGCRKGGVDITESPRLDCGHGDGGDRAMAAVVDNAALADDGHGLAIKCIGGEERGGGSLVSGEDEARTVVYHLSGESKLRDRELSLHERETRST